MLNLFNIIIVVLWGISAVVDYSEFCYYWQLKWYRWDRFKDFLYSKQGERFRKSYVLLWRSCVALVLFFWPINEMVIFKYIITIFFLMELLRNIYLYFIAWLPKPKITAKSILIVGFSIALEGLVFLGLYAWKGEWQILFLLLILRLLTISFVALTVNKTTDIIKKYYIAKATKKMASYPNLTVVGITGSYGKTTVKEFVSQLLEKKYKVIKTPKNINSDIGITKFILNTDFSDVDVFVVEIGAYQVGDVKLICDIVKPKVGILTAINEQHLALFGSMKNIQTAKYELLRSLPKDGLAITNSDNKYCREFLNEIEAEVKTFGIEEDFKPTCLLTDVNTNKEGQIVCMIRIEEGGGEEGRPLLSNVIGEHNILNIAPSVLVALQLGVTRKDVIESVKDLKMPSGSLQTYKYGNCVIVDDSYNSNPAGFKAALSLITTFPSKMKRVVITRGMLELGKESDDLHEKIGGEISFYIDELVIISPDSERSLRKGLTDRYNTKVFLKYTPKELLDYVKSLKNTDCVILLENRIFSIVLDEIRSTK